MPQLRDDRPALVVSSTSWTPDEDFGILLKALEGYESRARAVNGATDLDGQWRLPRVLVIITGRGPLRKRYMDQVKLIQERDSWKWVRCINLWLEAADYPILLGKKNMMHNFCAICSCLPGSADLGVSLHSSSSALDLPMKIVDMFGSELPVCALDFAWCVPILHRKITNLTNRSLGELVKDQVNGLIFKNAEQLTEQLEVGHFIRGLVYIT